MKLVALEIPDEPAELIGWLDRLLVGPKLVELIAELEAVHGADSRARYEQLDDVLEDQADAVLARGLVALPRASVCKLLVQPRLLIDLQERVLVSGGEHWDRLLVTSGDLDAASSGGNGASPPSCTPTRRRI